MEGSYRALTLAVAVFFCGDCGRAVHPKLHTGLLQFLEVKKFLYVNKISQFRSPNKRPNFSQAEKEMIVKVFRGISKDFAELTKTAQMEKTADYTGCGFRTIQRYLAEEKKCGQ
ncbi:hypothetical protein MTP99_007599 [Tenebrio molitor]|nr:hypothetical protein MTP99_007599 [Tenebrio molitor]